MPARFILQSHRGARGLRPENTLPAFECALDLGVTSIETDVHLTRDGVPVLSHDPAISEPFCRLIAAGAPDPKDRPLISSLSARQLCCYRADGNPDPLRFPEQQAEVSPLTKLFAEARSIDPYTPPLLDELFEFVVDYAGTPGEQAGKTVVQRQRARQVSFDLELKRVPFHPEFIGDSFTGAVPGLLETKVVEIVRAAGMIERTTIRSFDHRCLRAVRMLEPGLTTAVLVAGTAPIHPAQLVREAQAQIYAAEYEFLDDATVRGLHNEGIRVMAWTVNDPEAWRRLLAWEVDGITTDYPDRLGAFLHEQEIAYR